MCTHAWACADAHAPIYTCGQTHTRMTAHTHTHTHTHTHEGGKCNKWINFLDWWWIHICLVYPFYAPACPVSNKNFLGENGPWVEKCQRSFGLRIKEHPWRAGLLTEFRQDSNETVSSGRDSMASLVSSWTTPTFQHGWEGSESPPLAEQIFIVRTILF